METRAPLGFFSRLFGGKGQARVSDASSVALIDVSAIGNREIISQIEAFLAFGNQDFSTKLVDQSAVENIATKREFLRYLDESKPARYVIFSKDPLDQKIASLKKARVPYLNVSEWPSARTDTKLADDAGRARARTIIDRRYSLYTHLAEQNYLADILKAFREAKRNYPDLVLMLSAENTLHLGARAEGFEVANEQNERRHSIADIVISAQKAVREDWISASNSVLVTGALLSSKIAEIALHSGAALVGYDSPIADDPRYEELVGRGLIWSVGLAGLLGVALSESLSPEKMAASAVQSLDRLTTPNSHYFEQIDRFLQREDLP